MPSDRAETGTSGYDEDDIIDWPWPGDGEIYVGQDEPQEAGQDAGMPGTAGDPGNTAGQGELQEAEQGAAAPGIGDNAGNTGDQEEPQEAVKDGDMPETADDRQNPADPEDSNETEQVSDGLNAVDRIRNALKDIDSPAVTDELVRLFFEYCEEDLVRGHPYHRDELRLMPEFGPGKAPDWHSLVRYIYLMTFRSEPDEEGKIRFSDSFSRETFDRTAARLFPELRIKHRSSVNFDYENGVYKASAGWDAHGRAYFRLKSISRDDKGIYTASFDVFHFSEGEYFGQPYDEVTGNLKAVYDYVGDRNSDADEGEVMLEIFLRDDYGEILRADEHLEITFRISSDPAFAFEYLSCTREYLGQ